MPRRRNENGLKRQHRIVSEQRRRAAAAGEGNLDNPQIEQENAAPVPPAVSQPFENLAPPIATPRPEE